MNVFSALSLVVGTSTIFLGIYVLAQDSRSRQHQLLFALCASVSIWNFLACIIFSRPIEAEFWPWYRAGSSFTILHLSIALHFALVLADVRNRAWLSAAGYALSVALYYANFTGFFAFGAVERINGHWIFQPNISSPWWYIWMLYSHGALLGGGFLILRWGRRSASHRVQAQALLVGWAFIGFLLLGSFGDFVGSRLIGIPAISPILFALCGSAIAYAMARYRFLSIADSRISRDLLQSMDIIVLLLDPQRRVVMANRKAEIMFGCSRKELLGRSIEDLLSPARIVEEALRRIEKDHRESFPVVVQFNRQKEPITLEARISLVLDRYKDPLGTMIVGHEQLGAREFLRKYHITSREWEAIQLILAELPNREVAEHLGVTERTVKAHITHIYDKLGVGNKVGLFKMLQEYNLLLHMSRPTPVPQRLLGFPPP